MAIAGDRSGDVDRDLVDLAGVAVVRRAAVVCRAAGSFWAAAVVFRGAVHRPRRNRYYKGRSGPGRLCLASPLTVAASAVTGEITEYHAGMFSRRP